MQISLIFYIYNWNNIYIDYDQLKEYYYYFQPFKEHLKASSIILLCNLLLW